MLEGKLTRAPFKGFSARDPTVTCSEYSAAFVQDFKLAGHLASCLRHFVKYVIKISSALESDNVEKKMQGIYTKQIIREGRQGS